MNKERLFKLQQPKKCYNCGSAMIERFSAIQFKCQECGKVL